MSRASKLASARGETHQARHSTNVAREKLQRVTDQRDTCKKLRVLIRQTHSARRDECEKLREEVERLRAENAAQSAALEKAKVALGVILDKPRSFETVRVATLALRAINALPAAPDGWKLVPVVPTKRNARRGRGYVPTHVYRYASFHACLFYQAMLAPRRKAVPEMKKVHISIVSGEWYATAQNNSKESRRALVPAISFCDRKNSTEKRGRTPKQKHASRKWAEKGGA